MFLYLISLLFLFLCYLFGIRHIKNKQDTNKQIQQVKKTPKSQNAGITHKVMSNYVLNQANNENGKITWHTGSSDNWSERKKLITPLYTWKCYFALLVSSEILGNEFSLNLQICSLFKVIHHPWWKNWKILSPLKVIIENNAYVIYCFKNSGNHVFYFPRGVFTDFS